MGRVCTTFLRTRGSFVDSMSGRSVGLPVARSVTAPSMSRPQICRGPFSSMQLHIIAQTETSSTDDMSDAILSRSTAVHAARHVRITICAGYQTKFWPYPAAPEQSRSESLEINASKPASCPCWASRCRQDNGYGISMSHKGLSGLCRLAGRSVA